MTAEKHRYGTVVRSTHTRAVSHLGRATHVIAGSRRRIAAGVIATATTVACLAAGTAGALAASAPGIEYQQVFAGATTAVAEAEIDPSGLPATCETQWVSETEFAATGWSDPHTQACASTLAAVSEEVPARTEIAGLEIDTTYRYRFLAKNSGGETTGAEGTFVTFGFRAFSFQALGAGGETFAQAAGHPYELVTRIELKTNHGRVAKSGGGFATVNESATLKDVKLALPPGLIGDPDAVPTCTRLASESFECDPNAQVGVLELETSQEGEVFKEPLFNIVAPEGVAARFGARFNDFANAFIDASVRTGSDYGIDAASIDITSIGTVRKLTVKLWGVPADPSHNPERACPNGGKSYTTGCASTSEPKPFLTMPTSCPGSPPDTRLAADTYQQPGAYVQSTVQMPPLTKCASIPFKPEIKTQPTTTKTDTNTGLNIDLHIPQNESPEGQATADLKNATVTFPPGLVIDPSSADGLDVCSEEQVGFTGFAELDPTDEPGIKTAQFTPGEAECPGASKLGKVTIDTPLLDHPLTGGLYLARQKENPFDSLLAVYLAVYDPFSGVVIKLPGNVETNPTTGQLSTTFDQNPQLPFEDLEVELPEGPRAALTTPIACGSYSTSTELVPWSSPEGKTEDPSSPAFQIAETPGGGSCASSESSAPNSPAFEAGTTSPVAGSYSPFVLKLSREDGSQRFSSLNVTMPPGFTGKVAGIEECPQGDIEQAEHRSREGEGSVEQARPSCPSGSEVGVVRVSAGSGAPYYVSGRAYWAGPYKGAPFSLAIVTPAIAGPFDLGTVVVRVALFVDPLTAQVTARSDPFPTILDGIPLDIREVIVELTRPEFAINPTSCEPMTATGQETSTANQTASLSDRFKVGGCENLKFNPSFTVTTSNKTSKADGAELNVRLSFPAGAFGSQANMHLVKVELPKQLPSRLTTLQKACTAAQFEANPAGCPAASIVGHAKAVTPILPVPLEGPAYFVSHGGEAFPNLTMVLQGYGVTVELVGDTLIKNGITSSTFKAIPDVPVSNFELSLPAQPYSALTANANLCASPLVLPTEMIGQNGATIRQNTPLTVEGCKPALDVVRHTVHNGTVTILVKVPSGGKILASGRGLTRASKRPNKAKLVTLTLKLTKHERTTLAHLRGRKLRSAITLTFTPTHGARLSSKVTVLVR